MMAQYSGQEGLKAVALIYLTCVESNRQGKVTIDCPPINNCRQKMEGGGRGIVLVSEFIQVVLQNL